MSSEHLVQEEPRVRPFHSVEEMVDAIEYVGSPIDWRKRPELFREYDNDDEFGEPDLTKSIDVSKSRGRDINLSVKAVVLDKDNRFLVLEDRYGINEENGQYWMDLPGGHCANHESTEDALIRETFEETGLDALDFEELFVRQMTLGKETKPVMFFLVTDWEGDVKISEEHTGFMWVDLKGSKRLNLGKFHQTLNEVFERIGEVNDDKD